MTALITLHVPVLELRPKPLAVLPPTRFTSHDKIHISHVRTYYKPRGDWATSGQLLSIPPVPSDRREQWDQLSDAGGQLQGVELTPPLY